ncbi:MAG TPA: A24 family peptidase [Methylophilaceae bacterium]|nr:A24 family peptidase [Methylophilaceae bacterium]
MLAVHWLIVAWALGIVVSDVSSRRIPNAFSLGAVVGGLAYLAYFGHAVLNGSLVDVLLGVLLALLLTVPAYMMSWLGAGDVKLLLAIASLGGWQSVLTSFAVAGLLGAVCALAVMQYATYSGQAPARKRWVPFGAMLAAGLIVSMGFR